MKVSQMTWWTVWWQCLNHGSVRIYLHRSESSRQNIEKKTFYTENCRRSNTKKHNILVRYLAPHRFCRFNLTRKVKKSVHSHISEDTDIQDYHNLWDCVSTGSSIMASMFEYTEGVQFIMDDVLISAETLRQHD